MKKFSLKPKGPGKVGKLGAFSLKKGVKQKQKLNSSKLVSNAFNDTEKEAVGVKDIAITTAEEIGTREKKPLVITPVENESSWEYKRKLIQKQKLIERRRQKGNDQVGTEDVGLEAGIVISSVQTDDLDKTGTTQSGEPYGEDTSSESYQKVPIAEFGMAMLRGMGWTEEFEREKRKKAKLSNQSKAEELKPQ